MFDGRDGRLSIGSDGKLKINRSYFEQKFDYTIPENKSVNVTIVGTQQVTKLYINGEFKQALTRTTNSETDYNHSFIYICISVDKRSETDLTERSQT